MSKLSKAIESLTPEERKIYDAILQAFPATSIETAYNHAINGGINLQYHAKH